MRTGRDADHVRAQLTHPEDVRILPFDILGAHVDGRFEAEPRRHDRGREAMLAGTGFGDDALFAHALYQQSLAKHVVDLVCAGVVQVFALEPDLRPAEFFRQAPQRRQRRWAATELLRQREVFLPEFGIIAQPEE